MLQTLVFSGTPQLWRKLKSFLFFLPLCLPGPFESSLLRKYLLHTKKKELGTTSDYCPSSHIMKHMVPEEQLPIPRLALEQRGLWVLPPQKNQSPWGGRVAESEEYLSPLFTHAQMPGVPELHLPTSSDGKLTVSKCFLFRLRKISCGSLLEIVTL